MANTCEETLNEMYRSFDSKAAVGLNATYVFEISGSNGGNWTLDIKNGKCEFKKGKSSNPSVTISISDQDWIAIRNGTLNSQMAFMMGKLRVSGDMSLAMKLQSMFPEPA